MTSPLFPGRPVSSVCLLPRALEIGKSPVGDTHLSYWIRGTDYFQRHKAVLVVADVHLYRTELTFLTLSRNTLDAVPRADTYTTSTFLPSTASGCGSDSDIDIDTDSHNTCSIFHFRLVRVCPVSCAGRQLNQLKRNYARVAQERRVPGA